MNWRSATGWTLLVATIAALAIWAFRPQPISVEARQISLADFEQTIEEEGKTRVRDRYLVTAPAAGRLERIALKAGDPVEAQAVIAVLRPALPELRDARTISELAERVGAAEARKRAADAQVARSSAALAMARSEAQRIDRLATQGFVSAATLEDAQLKLAQQAQAHRAARFEQDASQHELALARATLAQGDQVARGVTDLARIEIRSPVAGRVLRIVQESEAAVALGAPLLEIGDPASLEAVVEVLSQDALRITAGMKVWMDASSARPALRGVVRRVEPSGHTKISTLGVEEQRVNVIVDFSPPGSVPADLGDGYRVDARIVVLERGQVPVVPVGALFREADQWSVFTIVDGVARRRAVELGARNQHVAWVDKGLASGELVVVYPPDSVADGVRVEAR